MVDTLQLSIGGVPIPAANIAFAGIVGQGLYQITVLVPSGLGTGDKALLATVAGAQSPATTVVTVQ